MAEVRDVIQLLEHLLSRSRIRLDKKARPFVLEVEGERYLFDPRAKGPLFSAGGERPVGTLRLSLDRATLVRLVTTASFDLGDDDPVEVDGDPRDLLPLAAALEESATALNVRSSRSDP